MHLTLVELNGRTLTRRLWFSFCVSKKPFNFFTILSPSMKTVSFEFGDDEVLLTLLSELLLLLLLFSLSILLLLLLLFFLSRKKAHESGLDLGRSHNHGNFVASSLQFFQVYYTILRFWFHF